MWEQKHQDDATLLQLITCIENKPSVNVNKDMIKNIIEGNKSPFVVDVFEKKMMCQVL
jgi:hypothetical protein